MLLSLCLCLYLSHTPIIYVVAKCCFSPTHASLRKKKKASEGGQPQGSIISNPTSKLLLSLPHSLSRPLSFSHRLSRSFSEMEARGLLIHYLRDSFQCVIEKEVNLLKGTISTFYQERSKLARVVQNMKTGAE